MTSPFLLSAAGIFADLALILLILDRPTGRIRERLLLLPGGFHFILGPFLLIRFGPSHIAHGLPIAGAAAVITILLIAGKIRRSSPSQASATTGIAVWSMALSAALLANFAISAFFTAPVDAAGPVACLVSTVLGIGVHSYFKEEREASTGRAIPANIQPSVDKSPQFIPVLLNTFALTPSEAGICVEICNGIPRQDIVHRLRITHGTLKNHLRNIYAKTIERTVECPSNQREKLQRLTIFLRDLKHSHNSPEGSTSLPQIKMGSPGRYAQDSGREHGPPFIIINSPQ